MFTPRKTPRQQRSRETVEVILEGAAQVCDREGITATTNRIAERAGVSIGTIYQYFPNKEALLHALAARHLTVLHTKLTAVFDELDARRPCREETAALIAQAIAEVHADRPALHRVLHTYAPRERRVVAQYDDLLTEVIGRLAAQLRRVQQSEGDMRNVAAMITHAVDAQLHRVLLNVDDTGDLAEKLTQILLAHTPRPHRYGDQ